MANITKKELIINQNEVIVYLEKINLDEFEVKILDDSNENSPKPMVLNNRNDKKRVTFVEMGKDKTDEGLSLSNLNVDSLDRTIVKAIAEMPAAKNLDELRSFLGSCSYYRKFIDKFSIRCAPLYILVKSGTKFKWTNLEQKVFEEIRGLVDYVTVLSRLVTNFF